LGLRFRLLGIFETMRRPPLRALIGKMSGFAAVEARLTPGIWLLRLLGAWPLTTATAATIATTVTFGALRTL